MKIIAQLKNGAQAKLLIMSKGLKCKSDHVATPLTNLSFSQGVLPNEIKVALMSPFV